MFIISPVGTCFSSPRQHVYCDRWSWRFGWVGQFFVRFVIRLVSKLELFIFRPPSFFSLTTRFLAEVIGLRPALGESHQSFAAFYRGQLSRLNPGPNRAFRIPQITHFSLAFPALFRSHNGCARTIFFASPKITQLYQNFFSPVVARYKRRSWCSALRSVFILAMPPFTTLKISPSFGFCLTDSLSENCTGPCCPPIPLPNCNLKPHSEKSKLNHCSNSPPAWPYWPLCKVSYRRVYCLKLRPDRAFIFQKWTGMPGRGEGEGWGWVALNTIFVI